MAVQTISVRVLGPVEVAVDDVVIDLGGPQQRAVIAHLAVDAGRVVSVERLIDRLWGEAPPRTPLGTLQSYVSRLRRALEPVRSAGQAPQVLVSEAPGYVLRVDPQQVDVHRFRALVDEARAAAAGGYFAQALERYDEALALWRGSPLAGVGPDDQVRPMIVRLEEERAAAVEDRFDVLLALGRHTEAVPALQAAVDETPLRERLWSQLALALYRSSRQADALRALSGARTTLLDELGLDPGPELRELEGRILAQDPALLATPNVVAPTVATPQASVDTASVELVGRTREWEQLQSALDVASNGRPGLVLIEGEPGIGKSTLCENFLVHARRSGWRAAIGRCVEAGLAPSLWPAIEIARQIVSDERAAQLDDSVAPRLRRMVGQGGGAGVTISPVEIVDEFMELLDQLGEAPWLLVLDDLHWADRATLDLAVLVLERLRHRRVLVVGAHRPPDSVPGSILREALGSLVRSASTTRVGISPLGAPDVARLMQLTTGTAPSAEVAERVQARAGGNPLFVAELARLAGERGLHDVSEVPDAIRDVVRGRLGLLPSTSTAELEVAAILGERFDLALVMAASDRDPDACLDALDAAIVTRILVPDGDGFRFAHALVRDAVLAEVSPVRRARLHQRAADALLALRGDVPDVAEPIAHHRLAAAMITPPHIVGRALARASDVARWRNAYDTAEWLAERALELLASAPRTPEVRQAETIALESIVSLEYRRGDRSRAELAERARHIADRTGSDSARAMSLFLSWNDIDETDDLDQVAEVNEQAAALAERTREPYAIVTTRYMLSSYALLRGRITEAVEHARLAIAASGTSTPDERPDHVPLVLMPIVAAISSAVAGDAADARINAHRRASAWLAERAAVDDTAMVALAFNRALVESILGAADAVRTELQRVEWTDEGGFFDHQTKAFGLMSAWAAARLDRDRQAVLAAEPTARSLATATDRVLRPFLNALYADALLSIAEPSALDYLAASREEAERTGEVWWLAETIRLQAVAEARWGDPARAAVLLDHAEQLAIEQGAGLILPRIRDSRAELAGGV